MSVKRKFCSLWIFTLVYATANAAVLEGEVTRIKDGDSLYVWNTEVRMVDIDAFEYSQKCAKNNKQYQCGALATKALKKLIAGREIRCEGVAVDRYDRLLATCFVGNQNINEAMVRAGWAVNYRGGTKYSGAEDEAKTNKRGVWAGEFMDPYTYRRKSSADLKAEAQFARPENQNGECKIKGNISRNGNKIYHTPWGSSSYQRTKISVKYGERWFCSEKEAEAAGWRAPKQ
jgi:endonuclease YncB( thermonuclease family)